MTATWPHSSIHIHTAATLGPPTVIESVTSIHVLVSRTAEGLGIVAVIKM